MSAPVPTTARPRPKMTLGLVGLKRLFGGFDALGACKGTGGIARVERSLAWFVVWTAAWASIAAALPVWAQSLPKNAPLIAASAANWYSNARLSRPAADAVRGQVHFISPRRISVRASGQRSAQELAITPGFRLYDSAGRIVPLSSWTGRHIAAAWSIEKATGKLHAVWVLNNSENMDMLK